jgi:hypothetical protein
MLTLGSLSWSLVRFLWANLALSVLPPSPWSHSSFCCFRQLQSLHFSPSNICFPPVTLIFFFLSVLAHSWNTEQIPAWGLGVWLFLGLEHLPFYICTSLLVTPTIWFFRTLSRSHEGFSPSSKFQLLSYVILSLSFVLYFYSELLSIYLIYHFFL